MGDQAGTTGGSFWTSDSDGQALRRCQSLVTTVSDGLYRLDADGRFVAVDDGIVDLTGYSREELLGEHVSVLLDGSDAARIEDAIRGRPEADAGDTPCEIAVETTNGTRIPCELYVDRLGDGDEFEGTVGVVQDITGHKEYQRKLEESERRYRTLVENFPNGAVTLVDEDLQYRTVGGSPLDVAGTTAEGVEGQRVWEAVPPELADELVPCYEAAFEGESSTFQAKSVGRVYQFQVVPVRDDDGDVFAALGMSQDITERKQAQHKLAESERRYRTLVENFPNGSVGLFDEDLEYTAIGGRLLDTLGVKPEDRIGHSIQELHPDGFLDQIEPSFRAALEGESNAFEVEFRGQHLTAHSLPVRNTEGEVDAGMIVVQDVTERHEYERRLEASNERLEQFAYAASHDLQEPLRMVSSYLQLIEGRYADELDEEAEEFIEFAVDGADRMREMIDGLLQYSRVDTRGDPFEPVDLDTVLTDVRQDLQVKIEETDAEITAEDLPRVCGDGSQLNQVLQNLLDNAIEYSGDEPPRVHVGAERAGDEWVISISDEGIGIDPENTDKVFEVFESLRGHDDAGTGIGLALVERIVERHGGDIWVDSAPGGGATFSFTVPAVGETDE